MSGVLLLASGPLAADPLRVIQEVDREVAGATPFPPETGFQLGREPDGTLRLDAPDGRRRLPQGSQLSFDDDAAGGRRVYTLDPLTGEVSVLRGGPRGASPVKRRLGELAGLDAAGFAVDAAADQLFALDARRGRILRLDGFLRGTRRRLSEISLPGQLPPLAGLARHPVSGHLYALAPASGELLELSADDGALLAVHRLPERARSARAIAIASSSDGTDDPARQSLFAATVGDGGGSTFELAVEPLQLAAVGTEVVPLVQLINMAAFSPPSPDPSGVELLGPNGPLLVSDAEVEEMSIYRGVNLFQVALAGNLTGTADTTFFSDEPTGVALNPANGHLFFSDDTGTRSVYEVTPGTDNRVNVGDTVRQIRFGSTIDTEGVAFGGGSLWVADGVNADVRRISPGPNGIFENGGDDVLATFDTASAGLTDPEGIAYDSDGGNLYVAGEPENRIGHFSPTGTLLRWLDTSAGGSALDAPAGLAYGPGPAGSTSRRLYIVTRGQDNGSNPNENDGKLFVFGVNPLGGGGPPTNQPPNVSAGNPQTVDISVAASLDGTVTDDGLPSGGLSASWSKVSGPGTVTFGSPNAFDTSATFSSVGSYVLRLTASDGQLSASGDVTVTVTSSGGGGTTTFEKRVAASADDAEQGASGGVDIDGSDLELVADGTDVQTVGLRFTGVTIPRSAVIVNAWIQFQADEVSTGTGVSLTIQAENADDAAPFTTGANNVGARLRTSASVGWQPPTWPTVGQALDAQRTPNLAAVLQPVVNRGGWLSGNAVAFVLTGTGTRVAESFEGTAAGAPLLHVVFQGAGGNLAPVVSAGPDRTISLGQSAALDGTVSDDNLPTGSTVTTSWSFVSGPGTVGFANPNAVDTTATFSAAGGYVLRLSASDGERTSQDEMAVSVLDPNAGGVLDRRIAVGSDDAEQRVATGAVDLSSSDLEIVVDDARPQLVGLRFPNLPIPAGATIQNAWLQFMTDELTTGPVSLTIQTEATANPGTFTTAANNVGARPRSSLSVAWSPGDWLTVGESSALLQRTPNLASIVGQAVSRAGWAPGNAIVFILSGTGARTAESFEGRPAGAVLLHVEYGPGG